MSVWVFKSGEEKLVEPSSLKSYLVSGWALEKVKRGRPKAMPKPAESDKVSPSLFSGASEDAKPASQ